VSCDTMRKKCRTANLTSCFVHAISEMIIVRGASLMVVVEESSSDSDSGGLSDAWLSTSWTMVEFQDAGPPKKNQLTVIN
jgi:hypothetical protein